MTLNYRIRTIYANIMKLLQERRKVKVYKIITGYKFCLIQGITFNKIIIMSRCKIGGKKIVYNVYHHGIIYGSYHNKNNFIYIYYKHITKQKQSIPDCYVTNTTYMYTVSVSYIYNIFFIFIYTELMVLILILTRTNNSYMYHMECNRPSIIHKKINQMT